MNRKKLEIIGVLSIVIFGIAIRMYANNGQPTCTGMVKEVTFESISGQFDLYADTGDQLKYSAPQWKDTGTSHPVCYRRNVKVEVSALFEVTASDMSTVRIRGKSTNTSKGVTYNFNYPAAMVSAQGTLWKYDGTPPYGGGSAELPDHLEHWDYKINWEISCDSGGSWQGAGSSQNPLYVILHNESVSGKFHESLAHIGCTSAKEENSTSTVVNKLWATFASGAGTGKGVKRRDGTSLGYYRNVVPQNGDASALLKTANGRCGSWGRLLENCARGIGLSVFDRKKIVVKDPPGQTNYIYPNSSKILINNWEPPSEPRILANPPVAATGIKGQDTDNPKGNDFIDHSVCTYGGEVYDPSYGALYSGSSLAEARRSWETSAIAYIMLEHKTLPVWYLVPEDPAVDDTKFE